MKRIIITLGIVAVVVSACGRTKKQMETISNTQVIQDTLVVKQRNDLNKYQIGFYSKSYSYYWLVRKDTLDFILNATEYEKDNTLHINIFHKKPILFATVLEKIEACLPLIKEDFNVSKLNSIYFKEPLYYLDLAKKLSSEYEQEFGRKNISYEKLNQFLLKSSLNEQLNSFLNPLNKRVKRYGIEKFHLMDKKYYESYLYHNERLSDINLTEYPEFILNGMGVYVQLENQ